MSTLNPPPAPAMGGELAPPMPSIPQAPMMRAPLPNTVLLTQLPEFLHNIRAVREWMGSCGTARTVIFVPAVEDVNDKSNTLDLLGGEAAQEITALVTLSHSDVAAKFMGAFGHFQKLLTADDSDNKLQACLVPNNPNVPLLPISMNPETVELLGDKLYASWQNLVQKRKEGPSAMDAVATTETTGVDENQVGTGKADDDDDDDDEVDPLTTPEVLAAVRSFRLKLETQQGSKSTRRKELVAQKIQEMLPVVRQRMQDDASRPPLPPPGALPPPPPPAGGALPPPPLPVAADSARRGVSNLPAWMTKQQAEADATVETQEEPASKRQRLAAPSLEGNTDQPFPTVTDKDTLRTFIASKIQQYVGAEDATLIDFILKHVVDGKTVATLLPELQDVLEEDAAPFCQALWEQTHALAVE